MRHERDTFIKELSVSYNYNIKDISKILKDKGFKINIRTLASQIKYFRWVAIIESIENDNIENDKCKVNETTIKLIDNYFNEYPDCWRTLAVKNSFS